MMSVETCVFFKVTPMNFSLFHVVAIWHNLRAILKKPKIDLKNNFLTIFFSKLQVFRIALELRKIALELRKIALELRPTILHFFPFRVPESKS